MRKITYRKLLEIMRKRGVTSYDMRMRWGLSPNTLQNIASGRPISTQSIGVLCEHLECQPGDLLAYEEEDEGV